ncbi:hypothetical protein CPB84DRAFT_1845067 [Gymnopilus junonius]|uniref:Uncharacterized protein n=1 Tax=Gymnopilus junonius TaxID=109634 RepID=A0A9P5NSN2_GYMJU|nr:hypothetical protein CPB84DRAFT_1845067 [Gymnopilus junonius]
MADVQESVTSVSSKSNKPLAFRTISNFLTFIQQQGYTDATSNKKGKELKLAVAFLIVASLETEVVAVGTKQEIDGVQVIVCSDLPDHFHQILQQPSSLFQHLMLFVRNLRNDHPEYAGTYYQNGPPKVIPIMVPPALKKELDMESLTAYIDELCKVAPKKANIHYPLAQHIYVIKSILAMKALAKEGTYNLLLRYIIATSFRKIAGQFQRVSKPYMDSLRKASSNLPTENSPFPEAKVDDTADSEFLRLWSTRFVQDWREKYPIINGLAAQFVKDPKARLYSRESLIEFHSLILDLLQHFRDSLAQLNMHSGSQPPDMCTKHIANIFVYGGLLMSLSRTRAFRDHLDNISDILDIIVQPTILPWDFDQSEESQSVEDENDPNDGSAEVANGNLQQVPLEEDIPPILTKAKPYRDWLRLILAEFEATDVLIQFFVQKLDQNAKINVRIVDPPTVDKQQLPWEQLFAPDSSYIPSVTLGFAEDNADILAYLQDSLGANPAGAFAWLMSLASIVFDSLNQNLLTARDKVSGQVDLLKALQKHRKTDRMFPVNSLSPKLHVFPGWLDLLENLATDIDALNEVETNRNIKTSSWAGGLPDVSMALQDSRTINLRIKNAITEMKQYANFFAKLKVRLAAENFGGRIHCEACLTSLIDYKAIQGIMGNSSYQIDCGRVIGVSKRCCPVCHKLIKHFVDVRGNEFETRDSHNTVTSCALPDWLPDNIIDLMNTFFGGWLRKEIIMHMKRGSMVQHSKSSGSSGGSSYDGSKHPDRVDLEIVMSQT